MSYPPAINTPRLLERFLRYVQIDTAANADSTDYPSSPGQQVLGKLLADELRSMGASDVEHDSHGLVWATIPASLPHGMHTHVPTILFNAHLDTSPEAPSQHVRPQVIESYAGGDIPLPCNGRVITADNSPALLQLQGHCLITSDGSTLLGGDDKAGVAAIMELAQHLLEYPHLPHGTVRILFTCDEEIGRGAQHMDLRKANAMAGYTLDGGGQGELEAENFSADQLIVRAVGNNIHPALGKGRMVNAVRGLSQLLSQLPSARLSPESTEGREGFLHPYELRGGVASAEVKILLRDFQTDRLDTYEQLVQDAARSVESSIAGLRFEIERQAQYRNMADAIKRMPQVVDLAILAWQQLGQEHHCGAIRGGTDGAQFSAMGLPTPNLSVGQHNIHSVLEFASLNQMVAAVEHAVKLLELWQAHAAS
jgi:tripeptide aminopeptidase